MSKRTRNECDTAAEARYWSAQAEALKRDLCDPNSYQANWDYYD